VRDTQYLLAGRNSLARSGPPPGAGANAIEERPPYIPPQAAGRLPPSDRVPRNLRELFGL
jgi:hypothetical protein